MPKQADRPQRKEKRLMKDSIYLVSGMTCSACSAHVQRAISKLDGVASAEVNLATETLRVQYDESKVGFEQMKAVVGKRGATA